MSNFQTLPAEWQYVVLALAAAVGTFLILFVANRIQARRKTAGELADKLNEWGLSKLATPLKAYSYGDYSQAMQAFAELAKDLHSNGDKNVSTNAAAMFEQAVTKIVTYYANNNATKAAEVLEILKNGSASHALFVASGTPAASAASASANPG